MQKYIQCDLRDVRNWLISLCVHAYNADILRIKLMTLVRLIRDESATQGPSSRVSIRNWGSKMYYYVYAS